MNHSQPIIASLALVSITVYYGLYNLNPPSPIIYPLLPIVGICLPFVGSFIAMIVLESTERYNGWAAEVVFGGALVLAIPTLILNIGYSTPPPDTSYICNHLVTSTTLYANGTSIIHSMTQLYNGSYWHGTWSC